MKAGLLRTQFSYQNTVIREKMKEKTKESVSAVVPIMLIVLLLGFTIAPLSPSILVEFIVGAVLVIIGMVFFSLGAELSMTPMGERVGGSMLRTKKLWMIVAIGFILGVIITISEPDLQVLAGQVAAVPNMVLILSVAVGVGVFLVAALLRILFGIPLAPLLLVFYAIVFALAMFVPKGFLAVAFDSGGVTTGPMTVPFIMALGVGISSIRNDKHAGNDSFGLVSLCSIGPILAVLILGMVYSTEGNFTTTAITEVSDSVELGKLFLYEIPKYLKEIALSLLPSAAQADEITNTATVTATTPLATTVTASDTATITPAQQELVTLLKAAPSTVASGGVLPYTLIAQNEGTVAAENIVFTDTLPTGYTVTGIELTVNGQPTIIYTADQWTQVGNTLTFPTGTAEPVTIPAGSFATAIITGTAPTV